MHTSEERGLPRKGDDPLGVPRNSTSWYRGDVLPYTNKHTRTISLHISRFLSFFAPSFSPDLSLLLRLFVLLSLSRMGGSSSAWADGKEGRRERRAARRFEPRAGTSSIQDHRDAPSGIPFPRERMWAWRNERKTQRFALQYLSMEIERISARTVQTVKWLIHMQAFRLRSMYVLCVWKTDY